MISSNNAAKRDSLRHCRRSGRRPASLSALRVRGKDAGTFLHAQLTNEVNALKPGDGNLSARVTRTGSLVRYFSLHRLPRNGEFILLCDGGGAAALIADLQKFAAIEDVILEDITCEFDWIAIQGPLSAVVGESVFGPARAPDSDAEESQPWHSLAECSVREFISGPPPGSLLFARPLVGDPGFIVAVPREAEMLGEIIERIHDSEHGRDLVRLDGAQLNEVFNTLRIEAGVVLVGIDVSEAKVVLPETGLEQFVVSYSKGCYLGQEVIARIRTYGSVPFVLRGLVFAGNDLERLPHGEIRSETDTVLGRAASRTFSPTLDAPIAFAFLDRQHRTPGAKLKIRASDGGLLDAEVRLLPFYRATDTASRVSFLHDRAIRLFSKGEDDAALGVLEEALRLMRRSRTAMKRWA